MQFCLTVHNSDALHPPQSSEERESGLFIFPVKPLQLCIHQQLSLRVWYFIQNIVWISQVHAQIALGWKEISKVILSNPPPADLIFGFQVQFIEVSLRMALLSDLIQILVAWILLQILEKRGCDHLVALRSGGRNGTNCILYKHLSKVSQRKPSTSL